MRKNVINDLFKLINWVSADFSIDPYVKQLPSCPKSDQNDKKSQSYEAFFGVKEVMKLIHKKELLIFHFGPRLLIIN